MGATQRLAQKVIETDWDGLPAEVREMGKLAFLDGMGQMLAGSRQPVGDIVIPHVKSLACSEQATVIGTSMKVDVLNAAFANGTFGHVLDYEFCAVPLHHPVSPVLGAVLPLAEFKKLPGRDVITALLIGIETEGWVDADIEYSVMMASIHPLGAVGAIGAAAACSKLLKLDEQKTRMAIAISASRVAGIMSNTGSMTKSSHAGNGARLGMEAALLAERGWKADENALEAFQGYYEVYYKKKLDLDKPFRKFGNPYRVVDPGMWVKMYPANGTTHWPLEAALYVREKNDLDPANIDKIEIEVGEACEAAVRPTSANPRDGLDGKFSVQYTVAAALLDGKVVIDTFTKERCFRPDMQDMLKRIEVKLNPDFYAMDLLTAWSRVTVWTKDGKVLSERCDKPAGFFGRAPTREQRIGKFEDCAIKAIEPDRIAKIVESIDEMESTKDISSLVDLVARSTAGVASRGQASG